MHCMITMHTHPRQTDRQTDEHHDSSAMIHSNERIARWKLCRVIEVNVIDGWVKVVHRDLQNG